jgi:methanogenic corrinoid protein MtbC1
MREKKLLSTEKIGSQVLENLKNGEAEKILKAAKKYIEQTSLAKFYDDVLKPVMYEVGNLWQNNELEIGTEHICSNTANKAIHKLTELYKRTHKSDRIVICTPDGELHNIACNVLESIFLEKGFNVLNISPSIPTDSVISYIRDSEPSLILVSVTLLDNVKSASRLVKNMGKYFDIPILMGGLAINNISENEREALESVNPNVKLITNPTFEKLVSVVMDTNKNSYSKILRITNKG